VSSRQPSCTQNGPMENDRGPRVSNLAVSNNLAIVPCHYCRDRDWRWLVVSIVALLRIIAGYTTLSMAQSPTPPNLSNPLQVFLRAIFCAAERDHCIPCGMLMGIRPYLQNTLLTTLALLVRQDLADHGSGTCFGGRCRPIQHCSNRCQGTAVC
jgi:hypothetical protein